MYTKSCIVCGKEFTSKRSNAVCCSKKCGKRNPLRKPSKRNGNVEKTCLICGKLFIIDKSRDIKFNVSCCSKKCKREWQSQNICGPNHPSYNPSLRMDKVCPCCGKQFTTNSNTVKQIYCSRECANRNRRISVIQMQIFDIVKEFVDSKAVCEKEWNWLTNNDTGYKMRVDIFCPSLNLAIEYDGRHHYDPKAFNIGEEGLAKIKARDAEKECLLSENGIKLVRFSGRISKKMLEQIKSLV